MKLYRYLHFLSIDIVLGALASSCFAARLFGSNPGTIWWITLALTVWLLYTADHMLDAWKHRKNIERDLHYFMMKNRKTLVWSMGVVTVVNILLIFNLLDQELMKYALFLAGLGKSAFDPAIQAYVSRQVSYGKRGMVIGFLETSWAGSTLIGIPCVAFLMNLFGWQAPFYVLGGLGLAGMLALVYLFPGNRPSIDTTIKKESLWRAWPLLIQNRPALGMLGYAFFISVANDNLFVVYGAWLEQSFHVSIVVLGIGTAAIGLAELCGEGLTVLFADRIGLRRSILIGLVLTIANYALIPLYGQKLSLVLVGIFLVFLTFEFTIVTSMSLCTEILPAHRATMMSAFFAAGGFGRVLGALMGGHLWLSGGIWLTGMVSSGITLLAFLCLLIGLKTWRSDPGV